MNKSLLIGLLILSFAATVHSQSLYSLSGTVLGKNKQAVPGASVSILNSHLGAATSANGEFSIGTLGAGNYILRISAIGYASLDTSVALSANRNIQVQLNDANSQLEEIVVTAQKKEELPQKVPISITVLSAKEVQDYRLWNIKDITAISPNLYSANPGDNRNVTSIRGITTTSYDPAIATYVDGVNQFGLDTYIAELLDVERIEILRGPQGTLYGRNAMGGVINVITKQPTNHTAVFGEFNVGSYGQLRAIAGFKTPLVKDKLYLGVTGMYDQLGGFYTNDFDGSKFDKQHSYTGNYYLKWLASQRTQVTLNVKHTINRNNGAFPLVNGKDDAFANPFHLNQNAAAQMHDDVFDASLNISHSSHGFNFSSLTAYQSNYRFYEKALDADFSPIDGVTIFNNYGSKWNNVRVFTQEFKFTSPANNHSKLNWTAGTYFYYQNSPNKQATRFGADAAFVGAPDSNFSLINTTKANSWGVAGYGQATYAINEKFDLTAGVRYDYEHRYMNVLGEYQHDPDPNPQFPYRPDTASSATFSSFSPKLSLDFHATANSNWYVTYSRGFRPGGLTQLSSDPSQPPLYVFKPENSNNFELGVKNNLWGHRLKLNLAAFYITVDNAQVPTLVLPDAITITKNAGKLESKGFEMELGAIPVKGLEIDYSLGFTDAKYKSLKLSQNGQEVDLAGKKQIFTPSATSMLAAQYTYSFHNKSNLQLIARGEWSYLGKQYFDLANNISQGAYSIANLRIGATVNHYQLFFWMRNVGDTKYIAYAYDFGAVHLGNPQNWGVTLKVSF